MANLNIFLSFHHDRNQEHANMIRYLMSMSFPDFNDITPNEGTKVQDEDNKTSEEIRREIRDKFLKDVDVTIVVVGSDTINRKHIDWEIRSSAYKFEGHKKSAGIVVVNCLKNNCCNDLESCNEMYCSNEKAFSMNWLPERLRNSIRNGAVVPIIKYKDIERHLFQAIISAYNKRDFNKDKWDVQTKMRRKNNESYDRTCFQQVDARIFSL